MPSWETISQTTVGDYYYYRPDYRTYWATTSTTSTTPVYSYVYSSTPPKRRTTVVGERFSERVKPEPEPASEKELHDFLFGGEDK